jgi:hypothetical protein
MIEQMLEGLLCDRDTQLIHPSKITLTEFSGIILLLEERFLGRSFQCSPAFHIRSQIVKE